jgi:trehalose 6-phosphate phosphatase
VTAYDEPAEVAAAVAERPRPVLIGLDVDGVLAPIVDHADDAVLLDGMADAVREVARMQDVHVAVVSGRSVGDLARFRFDDELEVIGSHGMESRGRSMAPLDEDERALLGLLDDAATHAATAAGDGAWVERKPASVVLHVRQAEEAAGQRALATLAEAADAADGASSKAGSGVLEAFARHADKGSALVELAERLGATTTVFVGDDVTDEDAFAHLGPGDVTVKVGDAPTIARYRIADPEAVLAFLTRLATHR